MGGGASKNRVKGDNVKTRKRLVIKGKEPNEQIRLSERNNSVAGNTNDKDQSAANYNVFSAIRAPSRSSSLVRNDYSLCASTDDLFNPNSNNNNNNNNNTTAAAATAKPKEENKKISGSSSNGTTNTLTTTTTTATTATPVITTTSNQKKSEKIKIKSIAIDTSTNTTTKDETPNKDNKPAEATKVNSSTNNKLAATEDFIEQINENNDNIQKNEEIIKNVNQHSIKQKNEKAFKKYNNPLVTQPNQSRIFDRNQSESGLLYDTVNSKCYNYNKDYQLGGDEGEDNKNNESGVLNTYHSDFNFLTRADTENNNNADANNNNRGSLFSFKEMLYEQYELNIPAAEFYKAEEIQEGSKSSNNTRSTSPRKHKSSPRKSSIERDEAKKEGSDHNNNDLAGASLASHILGRSRNQKNANTITPTPSTITTTNHNNHIEKKEEKTAAAATTITTTTPTTMNENKDVKKPDIMLDVDVLDNLTKEHPNTVSTYYKKLPQEEEKANNANDKEKEKDEQERIADAIYKGTTATPAHALTVPSSFKPAVPATTTTTTTTMVSPTKSNNSKQSSVSPLQQQRAMEIERERQLFLLQQQKVQNELRIQKMYEAQQKQQQQLLQQQQNTKENNQKRQEAYQYYYCNLPNANANTTDSASNRIVEKIEQNLRKVSSVDLSESRGSNNDNNNNNSEDDDGGVVAQEEFNYYYVNQPEPPITAVTAVSDNRSDYYHDKDTYNAQQQHFYLSTDPRRKLERTQELFQLKLDDFPWVRSPRWETLPGEDRKKRDKYDEEDRKYRREKNKYDKYHNSKNKNNDFKEVDDRCRRRSRSSSKDRK